MDEELCLKFCREEQYAKTHAEISFFGSFLNRTLQFKDMLWPVSVFEVTGDKLGLSVLSVIIKRFDIFSHDHDVIHLKVVDIFDK